MCRSRADQVPLTWNKPHAAAHMPPHMRLTGRRGAADKALDTHFSLWPKRPTLRSVRAVPKRHISGTRAPRIGRSRSARRAHTPARARARTARLSCKVCHAGVEPPPGCTSTGGGRVQEHKTRFRRPYTRRVSRRDSPAPRSLLRPARVRALAASPAEAPEPTWLGFRRANTPWHQHVFSS